MGMQQISVYRRNAHYARLFVNMRTHLYKYLKEMVKNRGLDKLNGIFQNQW